jgi:hypothetical protein
MKAGTGCQDSACCLEVPHIGQTALIAAVSDGAGSAQFSSIGSRLVIQHFCRQLARYATTANGNNSSIEELAREWLDEIRDRLSIHAQERNTVPREFAATLVAILALPEQAFVFHVGDGACVVRGTDADEWQVPSWPSHGEYASSTYFVTDDPEPVLRVTTVQGPLNDVAVFSDGLERLALNFNDKSASSRFFGPMSAPLTTLTGGRGRVLSVQLRTFLNSTQVTERTDDDKSIILAKRVAAG